MRNNKILELFQDGYSLLELTKKYDISRQRVYQILRQDLSREELHKSRNFKRMRDILPTVEVGKTFIASTIKKLQISPQHHSPRRIWYAPKDITRILYEIKKPKICIVCDDPFYYTWKYNTCSIECRKKYYSNTKKYNKVRKMLI